MVKIPTATPSSPPLPALHHARQLNEPAGTLDVTPIQEDLFDLPNDVQLQIILKLLSLVPAPFRNQALHHDQLLGAAERDRLETSANHKKSLHDLNDLARILRLESEMCAVSTEGVAVTGLYAPRPPNIPSACSLSCHAGSSYTD